MSRASGGSTGVVETKGGEEGGGGGDRCVGRGMRQEMWRILTF